MRAMPQAPLLVPLGPRQKAERSATALFLNTFLIDVGPTRVILRPDTDVKVGSGTTSSATVLWPRLRPDIVPSIPDTRRPAPVDYMGRAGAWTVATIGRSDIAIPRRGKRVKLEKTHSPRGFSASI